MNAHELEAAIDTLSDEIASHMTDDQQIEYWHIYHPRGGLPDPAAGLAYLQAIAASLAPDAPNLDEAPGLRVESGRRGRRYDLCDCGASKVKTSARCKACALALQMASARAKTACPDCGGPKQATSKRCKPCSAIPQLGQARRCACGRAKHCQAKRCHVCANRPAMPKRRAA